MNYRKLGSSGILVSEIGLGTNNFGRRLDYSESEEVINHLAKVGGKIIFWGKVKGLLLGEVEELWDQVAIAQYPNKTAMITMFTNEDYLVSEQHRSAGLEGQLNIITQDE